MATAIRAQAGPQEMFLATPAEVAVYGGAAGGGKTYGLCLDALRGIRVPGFRAVFFRRTFPQIKNAGSVWDETMKLYPRFGGVSKESAPLEWEFPIGTCGGPCGVLRLAGSCPKCGRPQRPVPAARVQFAHMQHEKVKFEWHGSQIPYLAFDELQQFTSSMFFYMLSRNRWASGDVLPYVRATANADADSWLVRDAAGHWGRGLISWWIGEDGFPVHERAGVIRWFVRGDDDQLHWADRPEGLAHHLDAAGAAVPPKSFTFIPASITDNKILLANDPGYLANLHTLTLVERERLLRGNWLIKPAAGNVFNQGWFRILEVTPADVARRVRYWDKAATKPKPGVPDDRGPAWTAGVKIALLARGLWVIEDVVRERLGVAERERLILETARDDGPDVHVYVEQEPGSGGLESADATVARLLRRGFVAYKDRPTGDKVRRAEPLSAAAEQGLVFLLSEAWNAAFLSECQAFPNGPFKDQVDAASGAYNMLRAGEVDDGDVEAELYGDLGATVEGELFGSGRFEP